MKNALKISVITVVFNNEDTIEDTIASVASQNHPHVEHIIVDGLSTDGTMDIITANKERLAKVISEKDAGIYDAMNKGIAAATGDIIGFLNADDVFAAPSVLAGVATAFADPAVDACYGDLLYVERRDINKVVRYWKSCPYRHGLFRRGWVPPHPTFYARKQAYDRLGVFNLNYRLAADYELMLRFVEKHHVRVVYLPAIMVKMRLGGESNKSIGNIIKQNREIMRAWADNGLSVSIPTFFAFKVFARFAQFVRKSGG